MRAAGGAVGDGRARGRVGPGVERALRGVERVDRGEGVGRIELGLRRSVATPLDASAGGAREARAAPLPAPAAVHRSVASVDAVAADVVVPPKTALTLGTLTVYGN